MSGVFFSLFQGEGWGNVPFPLFVESLAAGL